MTIEMIDEVVESPAELAMVTVNTKVAELNKLEAGFAELEARHKGVVYAVETTAGMEEAKKARVEIRAVRYKAQELVKTTKQALNQAKSDLEAEGEKVIARVTLLETPLDEQIKAQETRKAAEKAAADLIVAEAAAKIQTSISALFLDMSVYGKASADIAVELERVEAIEVSLEVFGARSGEAMLLKTETINTLTQLRDAAYAKEVLAAQVAEQKRSVDADRQKLQDEMAAFKLEQEAIAAAAQRKQDDERAAFKAEQDAFNAARKAVADAEDAVRAAAQKVLDDEAAAERKRLSDIAEAERAEQQRVIDEKREADMAEMRVQVAAIAIKRAADELVRNTAQDLLEACKDFAEAMRFCNDTPHLIDNTISLQIAVNNARLAITKATGEEA